MAPKSEETRGMNSALLLELLHVHVELDIFRTAGVRGLGLEMDLLVARTGGGLRAT
jgi:hypothetical protein